MITSRFLQTAEYADFGAWLLALCPEDRRLYFGMGATDDYIGKLISRILDNSDEHTFLVSLDSDSWLGVLHIAHMEDRAVEFGISVAQAYRNQGIGTDLLTQGITWARNRDYQRLYLHCVRWNHVITHMADKHGLAITHDGPESDVSVALPPASWYSLQQETVDVNRRIFQLLLDRTFYPFQEIAG